tara:strand:- start:8118 stop:8855 length:738 start_codon:yes stop_codon:yes gene_type:complete
MAKAEKKDSGIITMQNVIFMYTSVNREVKQLNTDNKPPKSAPTSPTFDLEFHSYEVKILISESRFKALKKAYKAAKNLPNAKEFEKTELLEIYDFLKADDLDDDMVLIKFSQSCLVGKPNADGVRKNSFPIKQIGIKGRVQDINGQPIDQDTSVGNGTKGHFQFRPVEGTNGLYLYPHTVCIIDLIEYVGGGDQEDLESLGIEELDETDLVEEGQSRLDAVEAEEAEADPDEASESFDEQELPMF